MNRKKYINQTLKQKAKKANAKLHSSNKPKYISKAERAAQAELASNAIENPLAETQVAGLVMESQSVEAVG
ncbi:DUF2986 domain-containing protein [Shewanella acanthi]|uniref:DUF2986 domain-containing protein n=1 Tax=Shewanella acanthi TaxID=2864212 RepID=UPI0021ACC586|nr:DUF2986 domain-containing protein [Shewanella acanthi]